MNYFTLCYFLFSSYDLFDLDCLNHPCDIYLYVRDWKKKLLIFVLIQVSDLSTNVIGPGRENSPEPNTPDNSLETVEVIEHLHHQTLQMVVFLYSPINYFQCCKNHFYREVS